MTTALPPLYSKVVGMLPVGKFYYASPAAVIAVCLQETNGQSVFTITDPIFKQNVQAAMQGTTLPAEMLVDAMRIQDGPLKGLVAKFRFEPGYWDWTAKQCLPSVSLRFICSCSIGVGQQMMRWVLPKDQKAWPDFVERFKSEPSLQLTYLIGNLEKLLEKTEGDLLAAYKGYNSGNINSTDPEVIARAEHVVALRDKVQQELQG